MNKDTTVSVHVVQDAPGHPSTTFRIESLLWAALRLAAARANVTTTDLLTEILVEGLAERNYHLVRSHGAKSDRQQFEQMMRPHANAKLIEHVETDVLQEWIVILDEPTP